MPILYETRWRSVHAWKRHSVNSFHQHLHDYVEILYIKKGTLRCCVNFKEYELHDGDVVFIFPGQVHSHESSTSENFAIIFPKNLPFFDAVFCNTIPSSPVLHGSVDEETDSLFYKAVAANCGQSEYCKGITQGYISLILGKLVPLLELSPIGKSEVKIEQRLIEYCSLHYKEPITLSGVASALGYSPTHLSHLFADKFKIGFSKFITAMRIEDAKKLLRGNMPITQIAFECGFGSMRNFNRAFKESIGCTPSEYKKAKQA